MDAIFQNLAIKSEEERRFAADEFINILGLTRRRKEAVKILKVVDCECEFFLAIESWLCQKLTSLDIDIPKKISSLLELSGQTRDLVKKNFKLLCTYLACWLSCLCDEQETKSKFPNNERFNECSILMVKLCLQTVQFLPDEVSMVLSSGDVHEERKNQFESMLSCVLKTLCDNRFTKECSLLAGTTIALLFNLCERNKETLSSITTLLSNLDQNCSSSNCVFVKLCNISIKTEPKIPSTYSPLILINGFVRVNTNLLLEKTSDNNNLLLDSMFELISEKHFTDPVSKYLCFETLHAWMNYLNSVGMCKLLTYYNDGRCMFLNAGSNYCHQILEWVWNHIEDLVDGIPATVQKIFALLLKLHEQERSFHSAHNGICENKFLVMLTGDILHRSWHEKGRWLLLGELIPYISTKQLILNYPSLTEEMVFCLATCSLCAICNEVFAAMLKDIKKLAGDNETNVIENWSTYFNKPIMEALESDNVLVRQNVGQYWIPTTVHILPNCLLYTENAIRSKLLDNNETVNVLHAYILVIKSCRNSGLIKNNRLEQCKDILSKGLQNSDLDVRIETFNTLCCNPKKTEPIPISLHQLLLDFVNENLNNDSSKFRQQMLSSLKKLLINIRNSCVMLHRIFFKEKKENHGDKSKLMLMQLIGFIEGLMVISKSTLHPGILFQRKKAGLLLFQLLSELFIYINEERLRKKGAAPDTTEPLFKFVCENTGKWEILSSVDTELLSCIEDQHDEIRELALEILNYHQMISNDGLLGKKESFDHTIKMAHCLLDSPKYHEAESGAIIMRFIIGQLMANKCFSKNIDNAFKSDVRATQCEDVNYMTLCCVLLKRGKDSLQLAKEDVLEAACCHPIFGILLAFSQIITCFQPETCTASIICPFLKELFAFCDEVSLITNELLSGTYFENNNLEICSGESSPSFADINEALDMALKTCPSYPVQSEVVGHLYCREMLLSFCWLNLKAISLVISRASNLLISINDNEFVLDTMGSIHKFYNTTLIRCRHKGVIESSFLSLATFSKNLASITVYWKVIATWCFDILQCAVELSQNASVTKRSAGIPMFIVAILSAEPVTENNMLLYRCMTHLLDIAKTELPQSIDLTVDLPQFNSLNIMRAVFRNASFGNAVLPFVEDAVMITINGFSSPSWSIRNASTILLGTLVPRMLGQRISQDESNLQNTSTADVFFYRYPKLILYFQNCLQSNLRKDCMYGANFIAPHTIPALTFLSKLSSSSKEKCSNLLLEFRPLLYSFIASPVFTIRELATSSIICFTPEECYADLAKETLSSIRLEMDHNKFHSLCVLLLKTIKKSKDPKLICTLILENYQDHSYTMTESQSCDLFSQGLIIDILMECYQCLKTRAQDVMFKHLEEKILFTKQLTYVSVGRPIFLKSLSKAVLCAMCEGMPQELSCEIFSTFQECSCIDLHVYFFKDANLYMTRLHDSLRSEIFCFTVKYIFESQCRMVLEASASCFSLLLDGKMFLLVVNNVELLKRLFQLLESSVRLVPYLLPSIEKLLRYSLPSLMSDQGIKIDGGMKTFCDTYIPMYARLADFIMNYSCPEQDENLRCAAAKSLGILWQLGLVYAKCKYALLKKAIQETLTSAMDLLQDEDEIVRCEANHHLQFVNNISDVTHWVLLNNRFKGENSCVEIEDCNDLQCNITLNNLFKLTELNAVNDNIYFGWLVEILMQSSNLGDFSKTCHLMLFEQEAANLYAEEIITIDLAYQSLQTVLANLSTEPTAVDKLDLYSHITKKTCDTFLKKCLDWLKYKHKNYTVEKNVYGLFGNRRCFITLYRILKYLLVLGSCLTPEEKIKIKETYINDLIFILERISVHPLIKEHLECVLCSYSVTDV